MTAGMAVPLGPSAAGDRPVPRENSSAGAPGLVLTTLGLDPIYTNSAAVQILGYPASLTGAPCDIHASIRRVLRSDNFAASPTPIAFFSGRRQYLCRSMLLDSRAGDAQSYIGALLFERRPRDPIALSEMSRRFRLSPRESETVGHLIHGLTTKEVAQQMSVSPNTVKQFVRIAMNKLGVTTRSGIVGKILAR